MLVVACSGFPIAASRYLQDFMAVEVADTELGIPGTGSIRRWLRESQEGFVFTVLAPAEIGASGFTESGENDQALKKILAFCKKLDALALVFRVPETVAYNRSVAARAKRLLGNMPAGAPRIVLDAPGWKVANAQKVCEATGASLSLDPLSLPEAPSGDFAYLALPGPAGHRSRYDDDSITAIADVCKRSTATQTICVFRNIDMSPNAKSLMKTMSES